jgi:hypothetical protein
VSGGSDPVKRLREYAGKGPAFAASRRHGLSAPWITIREAIVVADHIVALEAEIKRLKGVAVPGELKPGDRVQVHSHRGTVRVTDPTWTLVDYDDGEMLAAPTESCTKETQ